MCVTFSARFRDMAESEHCISSREERDIESRGQGSYSTELAAESGGSMPRCREEKPATESGNRSEGRKFE